MFELGSEEEQEDLNKNKYTFIEQEELPEKEILSLEKEMLGIYISGHPLEKIKNQIMTNTNINSLDLKAIGEPLEQNSEEGEQILELKANEKSRYKDGQNVKYAGIITSIKKKYTKSNKIMAFVTIEDLYGTAEVLVFENAFLKAGESLIEENIVLVDRKTKY